MSIKLTSQNSMRAVERLLLIEHMRKNSLNINCGWCMAGRPDKYCARRLGNPVCPEQLEAFGISGNMARGFKRLFMGHPPLIEWIAVM